MAKLTIETLKGYLREAKHFFGRVIWRPEHLDERTLRGHSYALLRVGSITASGLSSNRIFIRAAALSYYSLIALGPTVAIAVMASGFIIDQNKTGDLAAQTVNKVLKFIAPPTMELPGGKAAEGAEEEDGVEGEPRPPGDGERGGAGETGRAPPGETAGAPAGLSTPLPAGGAGAAETAGGGVSPLSSEAGKKQLEDLINGFINRARSGTVGVVGSLLLILIVIQLLISVEVTLNEIWGVRRGRSLAKRVFFYWGFISLGAVLSFSAASLISAATIVNLLQDLPFGPEIAELIIFAGPLLAYLLTAALLAGFYRFFPNARVVWRAALVGGLVVACLLFINYFLSFLYVSRVIRTTSLYGSVGIFPILMIGLYVFWLFVLFGGQLTYAVQNVDHLTNQHAWKNISDNTREAVSLAAFLIICRRFKACAPPTDAGEIGELIRAPDQVVNECIGRLVDLGWVNIVAATDPEGNESTHYAPARPLDTLTLGQFKQALDSYGNNEGIELIHQVDPVIDHYRQHFSRTLQDEGADRTFDQLLDQIPPRGAEAAPRAEGEGEGEGE